MTSKLQVTIPREVARRYRIEPGQEVEWLPAGDVIRVVPEASTTRLPADRVRRLRLFDQATERQRRREQATGARHAGEAGPAAGAGEGAGRGWRREELYDRGGPG